MPQQPIANGLTLEYESFGDINAPAVILIMGVGAQLIQWPEAYCEGIAKRGYRVIRFDNRDCGLSSKLEHLPVPNLGLSMLRVLSGRKPQAPYLLADMAEDTVQLLDALGLGKAHVVGASLGGMVAQIIAAKYPQRSLSLTSIMSTTSHRSVPLAKPKLLIRLGSKPLLRTRAAWIRHAMKTWRLLASPAFPADADQLREKCERAYDRSHYPDGVARQFVGSLASGNRVKLLKSVAAPTLVIHGRQDPLARVEGGIHTAECISNAKLEIIEGMGHDFPAQLIPQLVEMTAGHLGNVGASVIKQ